MKYKTIYFAGGCFWGVQKFFDQFDGVIETEVGYANGEKRDPSYFDVCHASGHAETVKVVYDENVIGLEALLKYYFMIIDPVSYNRQGADSGIQYRTGIYYTDAEDLPVIEAYYNKLEQDELRQSGEYFAVELKPLECFYPAEEEHQKYLYKNPGGYCHIFPKYFKLNDSEKTKS